MLRNIDVPGAKEIFAKQDELMATFVMNKAWVKANLAIHEAVRDDYFFEKIRKLRASTSYERGAAAFYAKNGTVGEF